MPSLVLRQQQFYGIVYSNYSKDRSILVKYGYCEKIIFCDLSYHFQGVCLCRDRDDLLSHYTGKRLVGCCEYEISERNQTCQSQVALIIDKIEIRDHLRFPLQCAYMIYSFAHCEIGRESDKLARHQSARSVLFIGEQFTNIFRFFGAHAIE